MQPDLLVVGLGNPGKAYHKTRHNVGFMVCDAIASSIAAPFRFGPGNSQILDWFTEVGHIQVAKPLTFMNNSGEATVALMEAMSLTPGKLCVICDDFNLPLGTLRIRPEGRAGGHNGLQSIIDHLQSSLFGRIRFGIAGEDDVEDWSDFVLNKFKRRELRIIRDLEQKAVAAVLSILTVGYDETMSVYNKNYVE